jgi:hypothetical protein
MNYALLQLLRFKMRNYFHTNFLVIPPFSYVHVVEGNRR